MAEINDFIDPKAEAQVKTYINSLGEIVKQYDRIFEASVKVNKETSNVVKSQKTVSESQKEANKVSQDAARIAKEQVAAAASLDRQRKAGLAAMAKAEATERQFQQTLKMEVKTLKDAEVQNKALNTAKKQVDITTKKGQQTVAEYNRKIDENTKLIQKNASADGQRKQGIGLYTQGVLKAVAVIGLAIAAFKSFIGVFSGAIAAFDRGQKTTAQLNAVIKSTGGAAGRTAYEIKQQAKALNELTAVSSKQITAGASMMLTFTNVRGEIFDKSIPAMLDMAQALASVNGEEIDLKNTSIRLGKALNDPVAGITALKRVGVAFTEQQKDQIKTLVEGGKLVEAQTIILTEIQKEFGGSAAAAGKVATASFTKLSQAWKAFTAPSGGLIVNILAPLADMARDVLKTVTPVELLSDSMEKQKSRVNGLVLALSDANISDKLRLKLYGELKDIAPEVVKGIDLENFSVIALNKNLSIYNKNQLNRILLQRGQEGIDKAINKQADAFEYLASASEKAGIEADKVYGKIVAGSDMIKKGAARQLKVDLTLGKIALDDYVKGIGELGGELGNFDQVTMGGVTSSTSALQKSLNQLTGAQSVYNDASKTSVELTEKRIKLADELGVDLAAPAAIAPTTPIGDPDDLTEKELKALEKLTAEKTKMEQAYEQELQESAIAGTEFYAKEYKKRNDDFDKSLEDDLDASAKAADEELKALQDYNAALLAEQVASAQRIADAKINILRKQLATGQISEAEYSQAVFELDKQGVQSTIDGIKLLLDSTEEGTAGRQELLTQLANAQQNLDNITTDNFINNEDIKQAKLQETLQQIQTLGGLAFDFVSGLYDRQAQKYEEAKKKELAAAGDNETKKSAIEEKYAKKAADLKRKQAIADKLGALFQIALNTAIGVTSATSMVATIPLVPFIIAAGALQAAAVLAKPIPAYKEGIKNAPRGLALVGEAGAELVEKNNRMQLIDTPSLVNLSGGETIYKNADTQKILASRKISPTSNDQTALVQTIVSSNNKVIQAIKTKKELYISADGAEITEREGGQYTHYFNRKVRWLQKQH